MPSHTCSAVPCRIEKSNSVAASGAFQPGFSKRYRPVTEIDLQIGG